MLGREVIVAVHHPQLGHDPLSVIGVLKADADIVIPLDDDGFDFTVGAEGALSINRALYLGASEVDSGLDIVSGRSDQTIVIRVTPVDHL